MNTTSHNPTPGKTVRIFISAAEMSADRHGASLIRQLRTQLPNADIFGVAGPLMQEAGCTAIEDWTRQAAMSLNAVKLARKAHNLQKQVEAIMQREPVDLAILLDSPALHLSMAKRIRSTGCPVLYYIAPQLWAWAPWRIKRFRRVVNRLAAILPFEQDYFRQRNADATYVGHPLIEQLQAVTLNDELVDTLRSSGSPVVACLPGSRGHVIKEVLPGQVEVARAIAQRYPDATFVFAAAHREAADAIHSIMKDASLRYRVELNANAEVLSSADLALVASGTATLEVAYYRLPMVVMYNGSKWAYRIVGRWLIRMPHLSLVNILASNRIVPEFMPYYTSTAPIAEQALDILENEQRRETMRADLDRVITSLGTKSASENTARIAIDMIQS